MLVVKIFDKSTASSFPKGNSDDHSATSGHSHTQMATYTRVPPAS